MHRGELRVRSCTFDGILKAGRRSRRAASVARALRAIDLSVARLCSKWGKRAAIMQIHSFSFSSNLRLDDDLGVWMREAR